MMAEQQPPQQSPVSRGGFDTLDPAETTVIRIHTADAFSQRDNGALIAQARAGHRSLRGRGDAARAAVGRPAADAAQGAPVTRDSDQNSVVTPPRMEAPRSRRNSEEATRMRAPLDSMDGEDEPTDDAARCGRDEAA